MAWTWELWWKTTKEVQEFYVCGIFVGIVGCWSCSLVTSGKLLLSSWLLVPVTLLPLPVLVCSAQTDVVSMNYWIMSNWELYHIRIILASLRLLCGIHFNDFQCLGTFLCSSHQVLGAAQKYRAFDILVLLLQLMQDQKIIEWFWSRWSEKKYEVSELRKVEQPSRAMDGKNLATANQKTIGKGMEKRPLFLFFMRCAKIRFN